MGDFEVDTIIGKNHKGAIVSIVDRSSKLTLLAKVSRKTSRGFVGNALKSLLGGISTWQRGLNENTNGLVRQYIPKKTDFDDVTDEDILTITRKLNSRPRKSLGFKTPVQVFYEATGAVIG